MTASAKAPSNSPKRRFIENGFDLHHGPGIADREQVAGRDRDHAGECGQEHDDCRVPVRTVEQRYQETGAEREHVNAKRVQQHVAENTAYHFDSVHSSIIRVPRAL